jgi:hypothetical protein
MLTICHLQCVSTSQSPTSSVAGSMQILFDTGLFESSIHPTANCVSSVREFPDETRQRRSINPAQLVKEGQLRTL